MEWQPIETAPRNVMTNILVSDGHSVDVAWYADDGWNDATTPDHMDAVLSPQPTHWMPFPAPPLPDDLLDSIGVNPGAENASGVQ